jgi:hypothetical protein
VYWDKADAGKSAFLDQAANPPLVQDASRRGALIRSDKSSWNRSEQRRTQLSLKIRNNFTYTELSAIMSDCVTAEARNSNLAESSLAQRPSSFFAAGLYLSRLLRTIAQSAPRRDA